MKVSASVYMTLKVEVNVGSWEAAQPFEALHEQAEREARLALSNALQKAGTNHIRLTHDAAIMHVVTKERTS